MGAILSALIDNLASQRAEDIAVANAEALASVQQRVDEIVVAQLELKRQVSVIAEPVTVTIDPA